jgi:hypothetical protein
MRSHFPDTSAGGRRDGVLALGGPEQDAEGLAGRALFVATAVPGTPPGNAEASEAPGSGERSGTVPVGHRCPAAGPGAHPATLRVPGCAGGESNYGHLDGDHTHAGDVFPGARGLFRVPGGGGRCERPDGGVAEPGKALLLPFRPTRVPVRGEEGFQRPSRGGAGLPAVGSVTPRTPRTHAGKQGTAGRLVACPCLGNRWERCQRSEWVAGPGWLTNAPRGIVYPPGVAFPRRISARRVRT